jgi:hypothetical protein
MSAANECLADALVDMANHSDDMLPWCLSCSDSEGCWAWNAMQVLTSQEIIEAKRRHKMQKRRKWARAWGDKPRSLIVGVENGARGQPVAPRLFCV